MQRYTISYIFFEIYTYKGSIEVMKNDNESLNLINTAVSKIAYNITLPVAIGLIMKLLHKLYPSKTSEELYELVRFKTNPSLGFQKSDIDNIIFMRSEENDTVSVEITLNFLSIFGASSPLPMHYNELVLDDAYNDHILLDFLDMLNHRLKRLIYPIWERQRYYIQYRNDLRDNFSKYTLSILGLYDQSQDKKTSLDLHKLLPFSGILSMHQKSSASLVSILKHYFLHDKITIEEGIVSKSNIPESQHVKLGSNNCGLGEDMCIGTFLLARNLKFRIKFDNITWHELEAFSYNGSKKKELSDLMKLALQTPLAYEISVTIKKEEILPCTIGDGDLIGLGVNGWIGENTTDKTIVMTRV